MCIDKTEKKSFKKLHEKSRLSVKLSMTSSSMRMKNFKYSAILVKVGSSDCLTSGCSRRVVCMAMLVLPF